MPRKNPQADELARKLVQTLTHLRGERPHEYPPTLEALARVADPAATPSTILAAVKPQKKAFSGQALAARADLRAPVALLSDLPQLAASPRLLEFALRSNRSATNHAASAAGLKKKLTTKLQKPFQEAIDQQIANGTLPPSVGWILINRARVLFLLTDLHVAGRQATAPAPPPQVTVASPPAAPRADFGQDFGVAFERLDRQSGGHNFVSLLDLRQAVPAAREAFDAGLHQLRLAGRYVLSAAEGRHGIRPEERDAAVCEDGTLLLYVSRRSP